MNQKMIAFMMAVSKMREAQVKYFTYRKNGAYGKADYALLDAMKLEREVDRQMPELLEVLKNGEQAKLFQ